MRILEHARAVQYCRCSPVLLSLLFVMYRYFAMLSLAASEMCQGSCAVVLLRVLQSLPHHYRGAEVLVLVRGEMKDP